MTLPGLSGSFLLILMGNYVLLLVDSVNVLFEALKIVLQGDINILWTDDKIRSTNTVLLVFLMGSVTGLVAFSHMIKFIYKLISKSNGTADTWIYYWITADALALEN